MRPKSVRFSVVALLLFMALGWFTAATQSQCIGVMPVYDANGESFAQEVTEQTTLMLFQELASRSAKATLLNPGGVYVTSDTALLAVYAGQSQCPVILVTSLLPVERASEGGHGDHFLVMSASLFYADGSSMVDMGKFRVKVKPEELGVEMYHLHYWGTTGSRPFTKQPIGRHAHALATDVVNAVVQRQAAGAARADAKQASSGSAAVSAAACSASFRVRFPRADHVSKSYDLLLDGSEESFTIDNGVTQLNMSPGEHLLLLHIADPPYKVPTQHQYAFNYLQDCKRPNLAAVLDVGGGIHLETDDQ